MKEYERKQLLERVEREGATIGATIPDVIDLQGEDFELRSFVFEVKSLDRVPPGDQDRVDDAKRRLRRERLERKQRLEEADISLEEGERLVESVVGIDRALNALEGLGPADVEAEAEAQHRADEKRWYRFLKRALGHERDAGRGRQ
ncbi:MAG: DUF5788 family protein [Halobacteriaceae archaeon]